MPLAVDVAWGSAILAVRGTVSIDGGFAFFRRSEDRTIDEAVTAALAAPLADFVEAASGRHSFTKAPSNSVSAIPRTLTVACHPGQ